MIGLFTVFEVMEPQGKYLEELYGPGEYKLTWMLVVTFPTLHVFYIYQTCIVCNPYEIYFGTIEDSLLREHVSANKIRMRRVKLCI